MVRFPLRKFSGGQGPEAHRLKVWPAVGLCLLRGSPALAAENQRIVEAFNWTVVFLMAMPYVILVGVAGWVCYHYTRVRRRNSADEPGEGLHIVKKETLEDE